MLIGYAWYCTLTRISDYKHHPTDVLSGAVLGVIMAFATFYQTLRGKKLQEADDENVEHLGRGRKERQARETLMM